MCGICGIYHLDGKPAEKAVIAAMNDTMTHRGPDGSGFFIEGPVALGHRRLSIIDLEGGKQPMASPDGTIQVVFNGEIYNFHEIKQLLENKGYIFQTRSDTESIIHAYLEWGDRFLDRLRGMFAIGLWDGRRKRMILARDRVGKKPLYYVHDGKNLIFGSELKAILAFPKLSTVLDLKALDAYLSFGYVPSPMSIFASVRKLPPAHMAICDPENLIVRSYWDLDMGESDEVDEERAIRELTEIFDESVRLRLISDVPLGAFLSGGVDSSAVVASMAMLSKDPVKTTSIGFSDKKFDEIAYARMVSRHCRTDHSEFVVAPDALAILNKIVWHLDEPFADASAIPTYYVSQMARRKVTVALSGDGGDETFAGYVNRYAMTRFESEIRKHIPEIIREKIILPISRYYPKLDAFPRPFRLKNFLSSLAHSFEDSYYRSMSFYFLPEMKAQLYKPETGEAMAQHDAFDIMAPHLARSQGLDPVTRAQYVDMKTYLSEDILVKVDRMSMAHSLEIRSPILDHKLMEYIGKLPASLKLKGRQSKYILKKMNETRLPQVVLYRKKQGFSIPLAGWLRTELRPLAETVLFSTDTCTKNLFEAKYIETLWRKHQGRIQDFSVPLWGLFMLKLWVQTFLGK